MTNQLNPVLREETLGAFRDNPSQVRDWLTTRELADRLDIGPQAAYGRLVRLQSAGWVRVRRRTLVPASRNRRQRELSAAQIAAWIRNGGSGGRARTSAYVMEWALSQKSRRATKPVAGVSTTPPAPPKPVEIEEVFYRQRRTLGQPER